MSTTANQYAPRLLSNPIQAGNVVVYRSPHARNVLLVDQAYRDRYDALRWGACESDQVAELAIAGYQMMNDALRKGMDSGAFSQTQCRNFAANYAVRMAKDADTDGSHKAVAQVERLVTMPTVVAMATLTSHNLVPRAPGVAKTQELIGLYLKHVDPSIEKLPPILVDGYNGHIAAQELEKGYAKVLIEAPLLLDHIMALPARTIEILKEFAATAETDMEDRFVQSESFLKSGVSLGHTLKALDGFKEGTGMTVSTARVTLMNTDHVALSSVYLSQAELAGIIQQHGLDQVQASDTPTGYIPYLSQRNSDGTTLLFEEIDGTLPEGLAFDAMIKACSSINDLSAFEPGDQKQSAAGPRLG